MTKTERETLRQLREFVHKMMKETILPPLYEQGLISDRYEVDVRINFRANTTNELLRKMEMSSANDDDHFDRERK